MDTGRPDLNSMIKVSSIPRDEPTFILRAQDRCAGDAVRAWAAYAGMAGVPPATLEQALGQADRMDKWPTRKLAGDDHLDDGERKQLEYQHQRREWNAQDFTPWRLAEIRGFTLAVPAELMRQLAREQHRVAARLLGVAEFYFRDIAAAPLDALRYREERRLAAGEAADRAAYFLTIAQTLETAATALSPAMEAAHG